MNLALLPLGPVPGPDEGRVKAYRKLARDGLLPPVLTWWVGGLQALVVLDGLCRLAAARAQGIPATILIPAEVDPARAGDAVRQAVGGYQAGAHGIRNLQGERAERAHAWLSQGLAGALQAAQASGITRAWPLPGGTARWQAIAESCGWGHWPGHTRITRPAQRAVSLPEVMDDLRAPDHPAGQPGKRKYSL